METKTLDGIQLCYEAGQAQAAALCADACRKSVPLIMDLWGLGVPRGCRVYVMTSWLRFLFQSAGWRGAIGFGLTLPLWYFRIKRQWPLIAGWTYRFWRRPVVGVKPPALLAQADTSLGARIFIKEPDLERKTQNTLCHELVHAFSAALRLPIWLNEGIAMFTADRYAEGQTVQPETLGFMTQFPDKIRRITSRNLMRQGIDGIVYTYVRAYWLVRFLEETHPGLIRSVLVKRHRAAAIEAQVSRAVGLEPGRFWAEIDGKIAAYFAARVVPAAAG